MPDRGEELFQTRLEKLQRLRSQGLDPYPPRYHRTHTTQEALAAFQDLEAQQGAGSRGGEVSLAGRITAMRVMGQASFLDLRDGAGHIQAYLRRDHLGDRYSLLKELDLGDFLGVSGPLFRTRTGEVTVEAREIAVLVKALRAPPEKWHGLKDVELRYRQRYLDLMANEEIRRLFVNRSRVAESIRRFLNGRGFIEVETPILLPVAAGAMARPFVTRHNALDRTLYLRIATELYLKRCLVGGLDKVYEIGRVFRNEGLDMRHNPEYTLLESYEAYADYQDVMRMVEAMVHHAATEVLGTPKVPWGDQEIDFTPPWRRASLREELLARSGIDITRYTDAASLAEQMAGRGIAVTQRASWGRLVDKLIGETVEPHLVQPTFLLDYPQEMSPLAKAKPGEVGYVERFEGFAGGMELANSFTELNDPVEQRRRFYEQEELRRQFGDEEFDRLDEDFLLAMEYGMPPTGGLGMGIDRLVMLFTGQPTIREVILFPHLSWSQEEMLREVERWVEAEARALAGNGSLPLNAQETLFERIAAGLPADLRSRVRDDEIRRCIESYLKRQG
ncbi:MAG: lysine--tRNA ligase [Chloroflexi bacterium]|nr:lysine--tRNA ligase [Chloroflexota bacterium]